MSIFVVSLTVKNIEKGQKSETALYISVITKCLINS
jgi:hypothetical protein